MLKIPRIQPLTTLINQACYVCFREESEALTMLRCSRCRRVSYCSTKCQKSHWATHKVFCKASHIVENAPACAMALTFSIADAPSTDFEFLDMIVDEQASNKQRFLQLHAGRPLTDLEETLVRTEPRCMTCIRTEQDIRIQAPQNIVPPRRLEACPDCKTAFFCCADHRAAAQSAHAEQPREDGHDGLSHCQINQEIRTDIRFRASDLPYINLNWSPRRIKPTWTSLKGATWSSEFENELVRDTQQPAGPLVSSYLRIASHSLTMPMTILWALEHFNESDAWTRQNMLIIHILGATFLREGAVVKVFEEILHRLPEIKTLHVLLCGPELTTSVPPEERDKVMDINICSNCRQRGRKATYIYIGLTYHEYEQKLGAKYVRPHVAAAFGSGSSQEAVASWNPTIKFLVKHHIPSVFAVSTRLEAEEEAKLLRSAGASLIEGLGPGKNPWGSTFAIKRQNSILAFFAANAWISAGFK